VVSVPAQPCSKCTLADACFNKRLKEDAIVINILTCRLEMGIDRNGTTKAILHLIRPKLQKVVSKVVRTTKENLSDALTEAESIAIVTLMSYSMGQKSHPLRWLFSHQNGAVSRWAWNKVRVHRRLRRRELKSVPNKVILPRSVQQMSEQYEEYDVDYEFKQKRDLALEAVEDGHTLSLEEYRVMRFCLSNNGKSIRLHKDLSEQWGLSRSRISTLYSSATRRVLDAAGLAPSFLASRGIRVPRSKAANKRRRVMRARQELEEGLNEEEAKELLAQLELGTATAMDLAWAYGVTYQMVIGLRKRVWTSSSKK